MTLTNMQLEDVLAILGRAGTVTLRKGTNDVSATPGHKADTAGWQCEVRVRGYLRPFGHGGAGGTQATFGGGPRGMTATEAAHVALTDLEQFLGSEKAAEYRACYVKEWEGQAHRSGPRPANVPVYQWDRTARHPGPLAPEIKLDWGD